MTRDERRSQQLADPEASGRRRRRASSSPGCPRSSWSGALPRLVLTGGTMPRQYPRRVAAAAATAAVHWDNVDFWLGDERYVPAGRPRPQRDAGGRRHARPPPGRPSACTRCRRPTASTPTTSRPPPLPTRPSCSTSARRGAMVRHPDARASDPTVTARRCSPAGPRCSTCSRARRTQGPQAAADPDLPRMETLRRAREVWFVASGSEKAEAVAAAVAWRGRARRTSRRAARHRAHGLVPRRGRRVDALRVLRRLSAIASPAAGCDSLDTSGRGRSRRPLLGRAADPVPPDTPMRGVRRCQLRGRPRPRSSSGWTGRPDSRPGRGRGDRGGRGRHAAQDLRGLRHHRARRTAAPCTSPVVTGCPGGPRARPSTSGLDLPRTGRSSS